MDLAAAERHLLDLELFGMRFGLDRMRRLLTVLGTPQASFASVHVVGSNGKSSTARMTAAILGAHGLRTGTYLSPHLVSFTERVRVGDEDATPEAFAAAVERVLAAAEMVDRRATDGDRVTQFEAVTAAGLDLLARAQVDVAVIEAGLGGRFDATNVLPSTVSVLTNVGLEHTRWLGPTIRDIAREKLDVLREATTLVVGAGLHPDALEEAERVVAERGARLVQAPADPGIPLGAGGTYQRANFALAAAAAEAFLGRALDPGAVAAAGLRTLVPGRWQAVDAAPVTILDGAHNPAGIAALGDTLALERDGRRLVAVLSVLDDKDAAAMLSALLVHCEAVVCTANANPRTLPPATLASLATQVVRGAGLPVDVRLESDPRAALALARDLAGPDGLVVATGSLYLIADLLRPASSRARASSL